MYRSFVEEQKADVEDEIPSRSGEEERTFQPGTVIEIRHDHSLSGIPQSERKE